MQIWRHLEMKQIIFLSFSLILIASSTVFAQFQSPVPVIESEIRDGSSIKMRSIELERVKRDSNKLNPKTTNKEQIIKFAKIKEDFEKIQKLQDEIIKAYSKGKQ